MTGLAAINKAGLQPSWLKLDADESRRISPLTQEPARAKPEQTLQASSAPDQPPSRWCLSRLLTACSGFLAVKTLRGLLGILPVRRCGRLSITRQRSRGYVHSPDGECEPKLKAIQSLLAGCDNEQTVVVFADELTCYNQPSVAPDYALEGQHPMIRQALGQPKSWRIMGCLNPFDERLTSIQRSKISVIILI